MKIISFTCKSPLSFAVYALLTYFKYTSISIIRNDMAKHTEVAWWRLICQAISVNLLNHRIVFSPWVISCYGFFLWRGRRPWQWATDRPAGPTMTLEESRTVKSSFSITGAGPGSLITELTVKATAERRQEPAWGEFCSTVGTAESSSGSGGETEECEEEGQQLD